MPTIMRLAMKRSGSGSHLRPTCPTHGSFVSSLGRSRIRSASVRPDDVGRHDAVAGVAARPREPGRAVVHHRRAPVARHAERPAPVVRDGGASRRAEVAMDRRRQPRAHLVAALVVLADRRAQLVRRAAAADGDAVVDRALRVEEQVVLVGDGLASRPAELLPHVGAERLGRDHQRVQRQEPAPLAGLLGGVRLGRAHHRVGGDGAVRGDDAARARSRPLACARRGPRRGARRRRPGRARGGPGRSARCGARTTRRAPPAAARAGAARPGRAGGCRPRAGPRSRLPSTLPRRRSSCGSEKATVSWPECTKPQSISSVAATRPISVTVPERLALGLQHGGIAALARVDGGLGRDERRHPAAVAPRRPEARDLALDHHDAQVGLQRLQVVGRPQAGEPRADDADVALRRHPAAAVAARASRGDRRATGCERGIALRGRSRRPVYWRPGPHVRAG